MLLRSGDLITFDASKVVHSLVGPPVVEEGDEEDVEEIQYDDIHCCISLYSNKNQLKEVAKLSSSRKQSLLPKKRRVDEDDVSDLVPYELKRLANMRRNERLLEELGLC